MWPPINDITTELEHASEAQRRLYPYVQPLMIQAPAARVFAEAVAMALAAGWQVGQVDADARRIEAVVTTRLLRFKDDVTITVRETDAGTRVDMRSRSRLGRGDLGTNARRIRTFLSRLGAAFLV